MTREIELYGVFEDGELIKNNMNHFLLHEEKQKCKMFLYNRKWHYIWQIKKNDIQFLHTTRSNNFYEEKYREFLDEHIRIKKVKLIIEE